MSATYTWVVSLRVPYTFCDLVLLLVCGRLDVPLVLWYCWLGGRKGIQPVKNREVGCWCGCLSEARCRLAYGPADATATHCLLLQYNPGWFYFLVPAHLGSPGKRAVKRVCVCVCGRLDRRHNISTGSSNVQSLFDTPVGPGPLPFYSLSLSAVDKRLWSFGSQHWYKEKSVTVGVIMVGACTS